MPQVDFYVLESESPTARWEFVARFLNKLQSLQKTAVIAVDSSTEARELDSLLWAFPPESFLPHGLASETDEAFIIHIGTEAAPERDVFINLCDQPPANHAQLTRLVEVVVKEAAVLAATRRNFKFYREQGYPLQSHPIRSAT